MLKTAFLCTFTILILLDIPVLAEETETTIEITLEEIIDGVKIQQERIVTEIEDAIFSADAIYREVDKDGKLKKDLIARRRIYMGRNNKRYEECLSMVLNGEELKGKKLRKEFKDWQKKTKSQSETKMPMTSEGEGAYNYDLIGSEEWNGMEVWVVAFAPKKKKKEYIEGKGYVSKDSFNIVRVEFTPAKLPRVIENMRMSLTYSEVEGYWFPVKFDLKMTISVGLLVEFFRMDVEVEDTYSNYKFNNQLDDSLFE
ncbi:DUF5686 family protein [Candidatus Poribacteria bacterium]